MKLVDLMTGYGMNISSTSSTHQLGGRLDAVAIRRDLPAVTVEDLNVGLSDHHLLRWQMPTAQVPPAVKTTVRRLWHLLDIAQLWLELSLSVLCQRDRQLLVLYDSDTSSFTRRTRPSDSWTDVQLIASQ